MAFSAIGIIVLERPMLAMIAVYGFGIALANSWNAFGGKPVKLSYVVVFGIMALVSALLLARSSRADS